MIYFKTNSPTAAIRMTQLPFGWVRFFFLTLSHICYEPGCGGIDELPAPWRRANTTLDQLTYGSAAGRSWKH